VEHTDEHHESDDLPVAQRLTRPKHQRSGLKDNTRTKLMNNPEALNVSVIEPRMKGFDLGNKGDNVTTKVEPRQPSWKETVNDLITKHNQTRS
jgi:hypothetical protein